MSKKKKATGSALLLAAAIVLVGAGAVGTTRALPSINSERHDVTAKTQNIDVAIYESGELDDNGILEMKAIGDKLLLGKTYDKETVSVANAGDIDAYIRVTVKKYWKNGNDKNVGVNPATIKIDYAGDWIAKSETEERTVLYYPNIVDNNDPIELIKSVTIDDSVASKAYRDENGNTVYAYNNLDFVIEVTADAVQTHNAEKAIKSVWGVNAKDMGINLPKAE